MRHSAPCSGNCGLEQADVERTDKQDCGALTARAFLIAMVGCVVFSLTGCRGRAKQDVYSQKMAREIRLLEDQLYEADYENRVLIEKLRRAKAAKAAAALNPPPAARRTPNLLQGLSKPGVMDSKRPPDPVVDPQPDSLQDPSADSDDFDMGNGLEDPEFVDPGVPDKFAPRDQPLVDPSDSSPADLNANAGSEDIPPGTKTPSETPFDFGNGMDLDSMIDPGEPFVPDSDPGSLLPAPTQPVPPGPGDLKFDPVVPGDPVPPNSPSGLPDNPPGQIQLPEGLGMLGGLGKVNGAPEKIELFTAKLSVNDKNSLPRFVSDITQATQPPSNPDYPPTEGIDVVVDSMDQYGHAIALLGDSLDPLTKLASSDKPQPKAMPALLEQTNLSVVVLDASKSGDEAKLGRWDFGPDQLVRLQQMSAVDLPRDSLRIPIRWKDKRPEGEKVVVFVRLKQGDRDVRCDVEMDLRSKASVAGWLPRR
ncbi:hypothetical protein [Rhodopirellula sp. P2]|uniref:hypothetical protein n=1 Tax=Rhodopirellula sp. P2 TaxID=2127060 RepID=UPI002367E08E|nr:hypothetical protein [Rhodopirellula sp. P2]WDQ19156.1 hypothetical protein PSR62_11610 [Rhodopirellula sp. P2]